MNIEVTIQYASGMMFRCINSRVTQSWLLSIAIFAFYSIRTFYIYMLIVYISLLRNALASWQLFFNQREKSINKMPKTTQRISIRFARKNISLFLVIIIYNMQAKFFFLSGRILKCFEYSVMKLRASTDKRQFKTLYVIQ